MPDYFSDRENGPRARTEQVISPTVWAGVVALLLRPCEVSSGIANASVLEVAHHTQRVFLQHRHVVVRGFA